MAERRYVILTAVGPDRPGLVQDISALIHQAGANLEDSRMAILGGEFALILLFSGEPPSVERATADVHASADRLGLRVALHETKRAVGAPLVTTYRLRVSGVDRPGIVAGVSKLLADRRINVASLESRVQHAPLTGTLMFHLGAEIQLPSDSAASSLGEVLTRVCDEESLEFSLEGANEASQSR